MPSDLILVDMVWLEKSMGLVALGWGVGTRLGVGIDLCSSVWFLA